MKLFKFKIISLIMFCFIVKINTCNAQQGTVIINQDKDIERLLDIKKEMNTSEDVTDRYKIQIYSGSRSSAENHQSKFRGSYSQWSSKLVYETPNYKIWVGNFRSRLEADRALIKIKRKFPSAFRFKPKKD